MHDVLYFNGRFTTTDERVIGVEDRGFQFGDALYEVFKFVGRRPVFLAEHFVRLANGLRAVEIRSPWDETQFSTVMHELIDRTAFDDGIIYIQISRGESERKHFYPEDIEPTVIAYSRAFQFPDAAKKAKGVRLITDRDLRWKHCDVKSVNLLANALSKKKAQRAGVDEVLLIDGDVVREAASSSFFAIRGGRLITHTRDEHILPGVVRDHVVRLANEEGVPVEERPILAAELFDCEELFITSTTLGVLPVSELDGLAIAGRLRGPITLRLQRILDAAEAASAAVSDSGSAV